MSSSLVQDIVAHLESSENLKKESEIEKFSVKVTFDWSLADFNVDIVGYGEEVIAEDLDNTVSKEEFLCELLNELKSFALVHIHVEITLKDTESNYVIFYTRSCNTFREKAIDLSGCRVLDMCEINIPAYNAEMFFYCPPDKEPKKNFFITNGNVNTSAMNSLEHALAGLMERQKEFILLSFICCSSESNHNNLKKCVEYATRQIKARLEINSDNFLGESDELPKAKPPTVERASQSSLVDLTSDNESDIETEECHNFKLQENIEDVLYDTVTSDIEDPFESYDRALNSIDWECFQKWWIALDNEYETSFEQEMRDEFCKYPFDEKLELRKIDDSPNRFKNFRPEDFNSECKQQENKPKDVPPAPSSTPQSSRIPKKISFGSTAYQPPHRRQPPMVINPPKVPPRDEMSRYKSHQPKLNRGRTDGTIDFEIKQEKKGPSSNLFDDEERSQWRSSAPGMSRRLDSIKKEEDKAKNKFLNSYKIPKKPHSNDASHSSHSSSQNRSQSKPNAPKTGIKYTEPRRPVDPRAFEFFSKKVQNLESLAESPISEQGLHSTPTSVRKFFGDSQENSRKEVKQEKSTSEYSTPKLPVISKNHRDNPKPPKIVRKEEFAEKLVIVRPRPKVESTLVISSDEEEKEKKKQNDDDDDDVMVVDENMNEDQLNRNKSHNGRKFFKREKEEYRGVPKYNNRDSKDNMADFYDRYK